jgi:N utilization substance protein A
LSLAIGKNGQNVRLAVKLTGWTIDVEKAGISEGEKKEEEADEAGVEAEAEVLEGEVKEEKESKKKEEKEDKEKKTAVKKKK